MMTPSQAIYHLEQLQAWLAPSLPPDRAHMLADIVQIATEALTAFDESSKMIEDHDALKELCEDAAREIKDLREQCAVASAEVKAACEEFVDAQTANTELEDKIAAIRDETQGSMSGLAAAQATLAAAQARIETHVQEHQSLRVALNDAFALQVAADAEIKHLRESLDGQIAALPAQQLHRVRMLADLPADDEDATDVICGALSVVYGMRLATHWLASRTLPDDVEQEEQDAEGDAE